jgi:tricorn protease-like protein
MKTIVLAFVYATFSISVWSQNFKLKLTEHTFNVESVSYSPDGKYLASGSTDGTINLYQIDSTGNPIYTRSLLGHLGSVTQLIFTKNSKYLVSSSKDYSSRIWNLDTPSLNKVYNIHFEPVTTSFLDASYKYLISASLDGNIKLTHLYDSKKSRTLKIGTPINDLKVSGDNKFYYVALKGGIIKKIETVGKNNEIMTFTGHGDEINAIELSPSGGFMASASHDKSIIIWDINTGKIIRKFQGYEWKVTSVQYSSDGNYIVGGCNDGCAKLFEVSTGKHLADFKEKGKNVRKVSLIKNAKQVAIATQMEGEKFGAVIYNTGVEVMPPASNKPTAKPTGKATAKPTAKPTIDGQNAPTGIAKPTAKPSVTK